jgi:phosphate transport system substrate-binding protein
MKITAVSLLCSLTVLASASALAESKIVMDGSTTVGPIAKAFAEYFMSQNPDVNITVSESGSGNGAKSLINSTCDIACMSRFMKDREFMVAAEAGVIPVAHVVALDGLPVIVHPSNPMEDLTISQIRDIFAGRIRNWKDLGGPDRAIIAISRDTNSGTYETFYDMIMTHTVNDEKVSETMDAATEYVGSNGAVRQRVQSTPAAIGYAGIGFLDSTVKALKVNGVLPSDKTVQSGYYPIARPLYMFTNGYPALGTDLHRFITLYLSPVGQELVEEIGFVPVTDY